MTSVKHYEQTDGSEITHVKLDLECPECCGEECHVTFSHKVKPMDVAYTCQNEDCPAVDLVIKDTETTVDDLMDYIGISRRRFAFVCYLITKGEHLQGLEESMYDTVTFKAFGVSYKVLSDLEADQEAEDVAKDYVEETILCDIEEQYQVYFDVDKCAEDMVSDEGRGAFIAVDDQEHATAVDDEEWYVYRTN